MRGASPQHGILMHREHEGMTRTSAHPPNAPLVPVFSSWMERSLSREQARALQAELRALVERYGALPTDDDATFVLRVALVPVDPSS